MTMTNSNPTPATVHARLCAYVDGLPGSSELQRLKAAAAALYVTRNTVYRWMHGDRRTPLWLENALNWLEDRAQLDADLERMRTAIAETAPVVLHFPYEVGSGGPLCECHKCRDGVIIPVSDTPTSAEKDAPNGRCDSCGAPFSMAQPDYPALCAECDTPTEE